MNDVAIFLFLPYTILVFLLGSLFGDRMRKIEAIEAGVAKWNSKTRVFEWIKNNN